MRKKIFTVLMGMLGMTIPACSQGSAPAGQRLLSGRASVNSHPHYSLSLRPGGSAGNIHRLPMRSAAKAQTIGAGNIYGYLSYSTLWNSTYGSAPMGLYALPYDEAPSLHWEDARGTSSGNKMKVGWLDGGKLCGIVAFEVMGNIQVYDYVEYDFATGELLKQEPIHLTLENLEAYIEVGAYNENNGYVYGYGLNHDGSGHAWTKMPASDLSKATELRELDYTRSSERCFALCYNISDNCFYGINYSYKFVRIDPETGVQTVLGKAKVDKLANYTSGMLYSQKDSTYMVNLNFNDDTSGLYFMGLKDGKVEYQLLRKYEKGDQYQFLVSPDAMADPELPARVSVASNPFLTGALTGTLTVNLPASYADGQPLSGSVDCKVVVDDETAATVSGTAGEAVSIPLTFTRGEHAVTATAVKDGKEARPLYLSQFFGADDPSQPQNVVYQDGKLTWSPVTEGVHGQDLTSVGIVYHVMLNGQEIEGSPVSDTTITTQLPTGKPFATYRYSVTASYADYASEPGYSDYMALGNPLEPEFTIVPTEDQVAWMKIVEADPEVSTWKTQTLDDNIWFFSDWNGYAKLDDWLITPAVHLASTDELYSVSLDAALGNPQYKDESFEIWLGTSPDPSGMTQMVMGTTTPTETYESAQNFSSTFRVATPGDYYIGIRATSESGQWGVLVRNIKLSGNAGTAAAPAAVTGLTLTAADKGVLSTHVSFTAPTKRADESDLPNDADLQAVITSTVDTVTINCTPGQTVEADVKTVQSNNTITVVCREGDHEGLPATGVVYTGVDVPKQVTDLNYTLTDDAMGVVLTWTPPTEGINGGYVDPDQLTYRIYVQQSYCDLDYATDTYTLKLPEGAPQGMYNFGVLSKSAAGADSYFSTGKALMGTPYPLPVKEDFTSKGLYTPLITYSGTWAIDNPALIFPQATAESGYALIGNPYKTDWNGMVGMPRFSTLGLQEASMKLTVWANSHSPKISVYGLMYGMDEEEELYSFTPSGSGWVDVAFDLPEDYLDQKYIWLFIKTEYEDATDQLLLGGYELDITSGIHGHSATSAPLAKPAAGGIRLTSQAPVAVYTADGRLQKSIQGGVHDQFLPLPQGLYIVKSGSSVGKVVVR